jgi:dynamin GTPase
MGGCAFFVVVSQGVGKSAVLNSLIGHPVLPTGENGATRAPILIQMQQRSSSSNSSSSSGNRGGLYIVLDGQATNVSASKSSDLPSC